MTANVLPGIKVDTNVAELEGLAVDGEAKRQFRKERRIKADDSGNIMVIFSLKVQDALSMRERFSGGIVISASLLAIGC